jgi:hypothetical protein
MLKLLGDGSYAYDDMAQAISFILTRENGVCGYGLNTIKYGNSIDVYKGKGYKSFPL